MNIVHAQESESVEIVDIIKKQGLEESQVMDIASYITDIYGPRLTGSPMLDRATDWAKKELESWGMKNVILHEWGPFGRGWELTHFELHAESPGYWPVMAYPKAWSPSASGSGEVVYLDIIEEADIEKYRGKLRGKFVLMDTIRDVDEGFKPVAKRYDADDLLKLANAGPPTPRPRRGNRAGGFSLNKAIWAMLEAEKTDCRFRSIL